jgi:DNA modification methylase
VTQGDARRLHIAPASIDLVVTSPPYLNGLDYLRCSKFSLIWMGHSIERLRRIRSESIGTEACFAEALESAWVQSLIRRLTLSPALSNRDHRLLSTYVWDMDRALEQSSRVLRTGGRAVYVVGDSMSRGTFIRNSEILIAAAWRHGLSLLSRHSRALPANRRYLPPPKPDSSDAGLNSRLRREVVVEFCKR